MPLSLDLAHRILQVLADVRREGKVTVSYTHLDVYKRQPYGMSWNIWNPLTKRGKPCTPC